MFFTSSLFLGVLTPIPIILARLLAEEGKLGKEAFIFSTKLKIFPDISSNIRIIAKQKYSIREMLKRGVIEEEIFGICQDEYNKVFLSHF